MIHVCMYVCNVTMVQPPKSRVRHSLGQKNRFLKIAQPGIGEKWGLCGIGTSYRLYNVWTLILDLTLKLNG